MKLGEMNGHPYRTAPQMPVGPLRHYLVEVHGGVGTDEMHTRICRALGPLQHGQDGNPPASITVVPLPRPTGTSKLDVRQFAEILGLPAGKVQTTIDDYEQHDPWSALADLIFEDMDNDDQYQRLEKERNLIYHLSRFLGAEE